jgi:hypothetical protein
MMRASRILAALYFFPIGAIIDLILISLYRDMLIFRTAGLVLGIFGAASMAFALLLKMTGGIVDDISTNSKLKLKFFWATVFLMAIFFISFLSMD